MFSLQPMEWGLKGGNRPEGLGSVVEGWVTGHSQAVLALHPLLGHPSHHPGPAGMQQGQGLPQPSWRHLQNCQFSHPSACPALPPASHTQASQPHKGPYRSPSSISLPLPRADSPEGHLLQEDQDHQENQQDPNAENRIKVTTP